MNNELITTDTIIIWEHNTLADIIMAMWQMPEPMVVILVEQRALVSKNELPPNERALSIPGEQGDMYDKLSEAGWGYSEENNFESFKSPYMIRWENKDEMDKVAWTTVIGAIDAIIDRWRYEVE